MSGDLSGGVSDEEQLGELGFVLRDLGRTGGEVRRPDEVRARHRRAVRAGLVTVAVLGAVAVGAQPGGTGSSAVGARTGPGAAVTVDVGARRLTVERGGEQVRVLTVLSAGSVERVLPAGRTRVTAKSARRDGARWVVDLAGPDGPVGRVGAGAAEGVVELGEADAKWLYRAVEVGDVVEVRGGSGGGG
ncbi:L,D-transpeptidase [Streptomyces sp. NPDC013953]|uniref:L,D-transpeptidase n=1 Tax=Streptomyces sp. NPDC013953 TaxID=3364868 RepID=UPI0036F91C34